MPHLLADKLVTGTQCCRQSFYIQYRVMYHKGAPQGLMHSNTSRPSMRHQGPARGQDESLQGPSVSCCARAMYRNTQTFQYCKGCEKHYLGLAQCLGRCVAVPISSGFQARQNTRSALTYRCGRCIGTSRTGFTGVQAKIPSGDVSGRGLDVDTQ